MRPQYNHGKDCPCVTCTDSYHRKGGAKPKENRGEPVYSSQAVSNGEPSEKALFIAGVVFFLAVAIVVFLATRS